MAIKSKTTHVEEQLLYHMDQILKIMNKEEPDHRIISIAIDNDYYSLMCGGPSAGDFQKMMNFSFHVNRPDPFVTRYKKDGTSRMDRVDIQRMDKYLEEQKRLRRNDK